MPGAERSAAPTVRNRPRFSKIGVAVLAVGALVASCGSAGVRHAATSSSPTLTSPAGQVQAAAMRALDREGPLVVLRGTRSLVISSTTSGIDPHDIARRVDAAVPVASGFWRTAWQEPVVVLVPASLAHWQDITGLPPDPDVAAVSLGASSVETSRTGAPGATASPAGGTAQVGAGTSTDATRSSDGGQRIVVDPGAYRRLSDAGRSVVLQHEVEHLVSAARTPSGMPSWLVEGTADVVGFTGSAISVGQAAEELAAVVRRSGPPASLPADADFSGGSSSVAYEEGWLACRLIDREKGAAALRGFYESVGTGISAHEGPLTDRQRTSIVDTALRRSTGWSLRDFVTRWRADLQHELDPAA